MPAPKRENVPDWLKKERKVFGNNFRKARERLGLSQRQIRAQHGFAQNYVSDVENGNVTIRMDNANRLAAIVGVPLWQLLIPPSDNQ